MKREGAALEYDPGDAFSESVEAESAEATVESLVHVIGACVRLIFGDDLESLSGGGPLSLEGLFGRLDSEGARLRRPDRRRVWLASSDRQGQSMMCGSNGHM